jgi:hypothetical protein
MISGQIATLKELSAILALNALVVPVNAWTVLHSFFITWEIKVNIIIILFNFTNATFELLSFMIICCMCLINEIDVLVEILSWKGILAADIYSIEVELFGLHGQILKFLIAILTDFFSRQPICPTFAAFAVHGDLEKRCA